MYVTNISCIYVKQRACMREHHAIVLFVVSFHTECIFKYLKIILIICMLEIYNYLKHD